MEKTVDGKLYEMKIEQIYDRNAADFVFPFPAELTIGDELVKRSSKFKLNAESVPAKKVLVLERILRKNGLRIADEGTRELQCVLDDNVFKKIKDDSIRSQAYELNILRSNKVILKASGFDGIRYGIVTLGEMFAAAECGAELTDCEIIDKPAFRVRGVQIDLAREFFPPIRYLKRIVDRLERLKANTLWLYFENRFHAPGMEDISPPNGLTPAKVAEICRYAAERGVDVVPGINVLSHMEGWFRLQKYAGFCDGASRSYPVLTDPRALKLVLEYIDAVADAFPSPNFQVGLDELLFTGTNPVAAAAIERQGKAVYFANFAEKIIKHLQDRGKQVWIWDDMVLGKNIHRPEGFNDDYERALEVIPRDVVFTHWYYWTNEDGKHEEIVKRLAESGRQLTIAPAALGVAYDYADFTKTLELQAYMAVRGAELNAFGYINTHWESRFGHFFEPHWPHLAVGAGFAWFGADICGERNFPLAFSFNIVRSVDGSLYNFLKQMAELEKFLRSKNIDPGKIRNLIYARGPHFLWRCLSPLLTREDRCELRRILKEALSPLSVSPFVGQGLRRALIFQVQFFEWAFDILDSFDTAFNAYHEASLVQGKSNEKFENHLNQAISSLNAIGAYLEMLIGITEFMVRRFGHTKYDAYALREHKCQLAKVGKLIKECVKLGWSLPYFEKLLYLPDSYHISNIRQLEVQNTFHNPFSAMKCPWLSCESANAKNQPDNLFSG